MLRLVAGMIAAFIVGGLVAMPFTSSSIAAQDESSDEGMVCCDETVQYGGIEFKTRQACRNSNGVVVENNKCEPEKEVVCCDATAQYDTLEFATRAACRSKNGVVVDNNRCEPKDDSAVADRSDAAGFDGARHIGDVPALSPDAPVQGFTCTNTACWCDPNKPADHSGGCTGMEDYCKLKGAISYDCTKDLKSGVRMCECSF